MKKITFVFGKLLFIFGILLSSCNNDSLDESDVFSETRSTAREVSSEKGSGLTNRVNLNNLQRVPVTLAGNEDIGDALIRTINNNGTDRAYVLPKGNYFVSKPIILPAVNNIAIIGPAGSFQNNQLAIIRTNVNAMRNTTIGNRSGVIICQGNNVDFRNFTIDGGHNFANDTAQPTVSYACVNIFGGEDMNAENMRFLNATYGFCNPSNGTFGFQGTGLPIHGLRIVSSNFINIGRGVIFNRVWSRQRNGVQVGNVSSMKKIHISGNTFSGNIYAGIALDAGNDGDDGAPNLRNLPGANTARQTVTSFNGSYIEGNTFNASQRYNVAFAKVSNIVLRENTFRGNTTVNFNGTVNTFARSVNLEHEANKINITGNVFTVPVRTNQVIETLRNRHIFAVTFTDYGNVALPENRVFDIQITNNIFNGSVDIGILGTETRGFVIDGNRFNRKAAAYDIYLRRVFNANANGNENVTIENNSPVGNISVRIERPNNVTSVFTL